jgi:hypothetical protein
MKVASESVLHEPPNLDSRAVVRLRLSVAECERVWGR